MTRSIAIDWLCNQGYTPVYIYFERARQETKPQTQPQTPINVIKSFLRQLLLSDISYSPNKILLEEFENFKSNSTNYKEFFISVCSKFSNLLGSRIIVLFDAMDECHSSYQNDVLQFIDALIKANVWVYVTARDYLKAGIMFHWPPGTSARRISANDDDIKNYVREKMATVRVEFKDKDKIKEQIITRICDGANGM
jgi:hypothetical protein